MGDFPQMESQTKRSTAFSMQPGSTYRSLSTMSNAQRKLQQYVTKPHLDHLINNENYRQNCQKHLALKKSFY